MVDFEVEVYDGSYPFGRLERNVVQDGRHPGVQVGRAEMQAGAARADR
jgi:hypothetical protein